MANSTITTQCCIAGGGPAGMMLGFLLARAGVQVVVLEKHADFFRDFRGDTVHPSTLELMVELGLIDEFLKLPHQEVATLSAQIGAEHVQLIDFRHLPTHCKFVALMPQWDFLNFLAERGKRYKTFDLRMQAEATDLIEENGRVVGLNTTTSNGALTIRADLVVGCDGRHSVVREKAGLKSDDYGAPMDVLWFRVSHKDGDSVDTFGHIEAGKLMVMFDRGDYWQCAYVIPKGGIERMKSEGLEAFRGQVVEMSPFLSDRVGELKTWDDVKLLSVTVDRLRKWWRPGLICIGDAAHAMSPIGGVGINMAVQDAVAAANRLAEPLRDRQGDGCGSSGDRGSPHSAHALYPRAAAYHPAANHHPRPRKPTAAEAARRVEAVRRLSDSASHTGAIDRSRHSSRTRADARSVGASLRGRTRGFPSARERLSVDAERVARHALKRIGFGDLRPRPATHSLARRGAKRERCMDRLGKRGRFARRNKPAGARLGVRVRRGGHDFTSRSDVGDDGKRPDRGRLDRSARHAVDFRGGKNHDRGADERSWRIGRGADADKHGLDAALDCECVQLARESRLRRFARQYETNVVEALSLDEGRCFDKRLLAAARS